MTFTLQQIEVDLNPAKIYLNTLLRKNASEKAIQWLDQKLNHIVDLQSERDIYLSFSMASRYVGKSAINLSLKDLNQAEALCPGLFPFNWTNDQIARTLILLTIPHKDPQVYKEILNKLFITADVDELVALYTSLPLLPFPEEHIARAAEGIRTNMTIVFESVALHNPYPARHFSEGAWNQLVLKALFTARPLHKIYGLEIRRNVKLSRMAINYAHEQWAAGRTVSPELWRLIAPYDQPELIVDLQKLLSSKDPLQQQAAALVCMEYLSDETCRLISAYPQLKKDIEENNISWTSLGMNWTAAQLH